jgi:hypothetical protein
MKYQSIEEFKAIEDCDMLDDWVAERTQEFFRHLSKALKGQVIQGFGSKDDSMWGRHDKVQNFKIKSVTLEETSMPWIDHDNKGLPSKIVLSVNVALTGYHAEKTGLLYTSEKAERDIKKHLDNLLGKQASISWSEQGMQNYDNTVNFDMTIKPELIAKDYVDYCKYLYRVRQLEKNAVVPEGKVEDDIKKLFKPQSQ